MPFNYLVSLVSGKIYVDLLDKLPDLVDYDPVVHVLTAHHILHDILIIDVRYDHLCADSAKGVTLGTFDLLRSLEAS